MPYTITQIAEACHEVIRVIQKANGEADVSPHWDEAPEWQCESAVSGVTTAAAGQTPEGQFMLWRAAKLADGWVYGPVKDAEAKTHPCIVDDYADLPEGQRVKDALFLAVVGALTAERAATRSAAAAHS